MNTLTWVGFGHFVARVVVTAVVVVVVVYAAGFAWTKGVKAGVA